MRTRKVKRNLLAESLELRQLLHGGALAGAGEPATTEERATEVVTRFDANEDMELSQDEVSERIWNRISEADGDESSTVSVAELTVHLDAAAADRAENGTENGGGDRNRDQNRDGNRGDRRDRSDSRGERLSVEDRIDMFFAENDTNSDGVITEADDVSEELLARIVEADVDGDGVSAEDLMARHEARVQARFDARFDALDENDDGGITADEVSERRWERISAADGEDGDGMVTAEELQTYLDAQRAEREAVEETVEEAEEETVTEEGGENGEPVVAGGNEDQPQRQRNRGRTGRRR